MWAGDRTVKLPSTSKNFSTSAWLTVQPMPWAMSYARARRVAADLCLCSLARQPHRVQP
eukprot:CAMPEP_0178894730 /NCGR_PEP_ID=MMETSP0786-20121207/181_1 /TAXON_ID=186022 /ORGANISM="Thalassionema frauenfeldii, Strain CCMP 1798" /LENGTH=58 /DNA_ID=CAMNT_0020564857 /DNA_START=1562 /DNA_END=1738 /DNA_ORIENTATION=-